MNIVVNRVNTSWEFRELSWFLTDFWWFGGKFILFDTFYPKKFIHLLDLESNIFPTSANKTIKFSLQSFKTSEEK